jgi:SAM-dependent methyltransferase
LEDDARRLTILDYGAGTGFFSKLLACRGHAPVTLDFAANMLKLGAKEYELPFPVMAVTPPLPFQDETFDAVVANGVLHHCKAQGALEEIVREIHRTLKPGGMLLLFDRNGAFLGRHLHQFVMHVKQRMEARGHVSSSASTHEPDFNDRDVACILDAGFRIVRRRYVSTLPTFMSIVVGNTTEYAGHPKIAAALRYALFPFIFLFETIMPFNWFTVEQCVRFEKEDAGNGDSAVESSLPS